MNVLMISMDATLLSGAIGDARTRHEEYARRVGSLSIVVCSTAQLKPLDVALDGSAAGALHIVPTNSRNRIAYVPDGIRAGQRMAHPAVIITQDPFLTGIVGWRLSRILKAPLIIQIHTSALENREFARESRINRLLQQIARWIVRRADAVRVTNHSEREACIRLGIPADRVYVIPTATDLARFMQPATEIDWRARLGLAAQDRVALWVGRPVYVKNLPLLIDAFARVHAQYPAAKLVLAGDITNAAITAQITRLSLGGVVRLTGRVPHADLPSLYQAADVYVHSSRYEGFGLVLVEAAAAGLPLISTITDGARDIIRQDETGLLVPADADALAQAIGQLLGDPARAKAMGQNARADVTERFDPERLIGEWVGLWRAVANRP